MLRPTLRTIVPLFFFVAACASSGAGTAEGPCESDDDCLIGAVCEDGSCVGGGDSGVDSTDSGGGTDSVDDEDVTVLDSGDDDVTIDANPDSGSDTDIPPGVFGAPCEIDSDCDSGYCVDTDEGKVCTVQCSDTCPAAEWSCRRVTDSGGDLVSICVPDADFLCDECQSDTDCGGLGDLCVPTAEGNSCGRACSEEDVCPAGFICSSVELEDGSSVFQCFPETGVCDCVDADNDMYGDGPACIDDDCDDLNPATYPDAEEICDGMDNDCDGDADETFDLTSVDSCLRCDVQCEFPNATAVCTETGCRIDACATNYWDVDGDPETGCEYACILSNDGVEICDGVDNDCNGTPDDGFDLQTNAEHCGRCGNACSTEQNVGMVACEAGECVATCEADFLDCDGLYASGCEESRLSPETCLACDNECAFPNAVAGCSETGCVLIECTANFYDDPTEPGQDCLYACIPDNGGVEICDGRDNDCDFDTDEGFDLMLDPSNCGTCGTTCDAPNAANQCVEGDCVYTCMEDFGDCTDAPGCETNLQTDVDNCNSCENECTLPGGTNICVEGTCDISNCTAPQDNCTLDPGCETNTDSSTEHCGGCGLPCDYLNGEAVCNTGTCMFVGCEDGFHDLDGDEQCEYACDEGFPDDADAPDFDGPDGVGVDNNCDGIDGDIDRSIYVSTVGADSASGQFDPVTRTFRPVRSIEVGIQRALDAGFSTVLVAAGTYSGQVNLANGISLYGGYDPASWARQSSAESIIRQGSVSAHMVAIDANNISSPTRIDGFRVEVVNNNAASGNVYGVRVRGSNSALVFSNLTLDVGSGGAGVDGVAGNPGASGGNGGNGGQGESGGSGGGYGGGGGSSSCSGGGGGGRGGHDRNAGASGGGPGGGGGAGAQTCSNGTICSDCAGGRRTGNRGNNGGNGGNGGHGSDGAGGNAGGSLVGGWWVGTDGGNGSNGAHGAGGGGGGGGGGGTSYCPLYGTCWAAYTCASDRGGGGGGGGGAGCLGTRGTGGTSGGGAFGFFILGSDPVIENCDVTVGRGGNGGRGRPGGNGGTGGGGASGGGGPDDGGDGGNGGRGGNGGNGGDGGGGAGGVSYGIYSANGGSPSVSGVTYTIGGGGTGGAGGNGGNGGANGASGNRN